MGELLICSHISNFRCEVRRAYDPIPGNTQKIPGNSQKLSENSWKVVKTPETVVKTPEAVWNLRLENALEFRDWRQEPREYRLETGDWRLK